MPQGDGRTGPATRGLGDEPVGRDTRRDDPRGTDELTSGEPDRRGLPPWLVRVAGVVAVAVAAVVALPHLLSSDAHPAPHRPPATDASPSPTATATLDPTPTLPAELSWPTRGDLVGDAAFLDTVQDVARTDGGLSVVHEVLFAGRVGTARVALVAGLTPDDLAAAASGDGGPGEQVVDVVLPGDGSAQRASSVGEIAVGDDSPVSVVPVAGHALLLGRPAAARWEISTSVTFTPDGRGHRAWRSVSAPEGWALVPVPVSPLPALAVRTGPGEESSVELDPTLAQTVPEQAVEGLGAGYAGPAPAALRQIVAGQLAEPGFSGRAFRARVVWSGRTGAGGLDPTALVVLMRSDGATFEIAVAQQPDGVSSDEAVSIPWAHPERHVADLRAMLDGVVVLPGRTGRLTWSDGSSGGTVRLSPQGVADLPAVPSLETGGLTLVVHGPSGTHRVGRSELAEYSASGL